MAGRGGRADGHQHRVPRARKAKEADKRHGHGIGGVRRGARGRVAAVVTAEVGTAAAVAVAALGMDRLACSAAAVAAGGRTGPALRVTARRRRGRTRPRRLAVAATPVHNVVVCTAARHGTRAALRDAQAQRSRGAPSVRPLRGPPLRCTVVHLNARARKSTTNGRVVERSSTQAA